MEQLKFDQNQPNHLIQNTPMKEMNYLPSVINIIDYTKSKSILIILLLFLSTSSFGQWTANLWERFERACAKVIPKLAFVALFLLCTNLTNAQWMLINQSGGTPNASAALELRTTDRGFLAPRMTTPQMNAISTPAAGLLIYNTDSSAFFYNNGSGWANIASAGATQFAVPAGSILSFAGDTANVPAGFLLCNGASLAQASYSELFAAIGTAWGGDASNFNLPDLRGRFLRGTDLNAGNDPDAAGRTAMNTGGNTGDDVGSLQEDATARPNTNFTTNITGAHTHDYVEFTTVNGNVDLFNSSPSHNRQTGSTSSSGNHSHSITGGGDNETRPINANVNYIICYSSSIAAAGTNSSVFQGSISSAQLPNSVQDSSRITDNDGSAKVQALSSDRIVFTTNSNEVMRISSNGYVGINTNSPQQLLDVAGTAVIDSLRIYNAYALPSDAGTNGQVLQTDGSGKAEWKTPTASPWTLSGNDIYYSTGKVGISGTDTSGNLTVFSDAPNALVLKSNANTDTVGIAFKNNGNNYSWGISRQHVTSDKSNLIFRGGNPTTNPSALDQIMKLSYTGQVSIGTNNSDSMLTVGGGIKAENIRLTTGAGAGKVLTSFDGTGKATWQTPASSPWTVSGSNVYRTVGRVGIGTNNPSAQLTVSDTGSATVRIESYNSDLASASHLRFTRARGTEGSPTTLVDDDAIGSIKVSGYDGSNYRISSQIDFEVDSTPGSSDIPGRITFSTRASGGSSVSERMRIDRNGNVGIGTASPNAKLHVEGKTQFSEDSDAIIFKNSSGVTQATIGITDGNGRFNIYQGADSSGDYYVQTGEAATRLRMHNTGFHFYSAPSGTADNLVPWDEQFTILNTGLVGIGQGTPTSKLHVSGNTTIDQLPTSTTGFTIRRNDDLSDIMRVFTGTGKNGNLALHNAAGTTTIRFSGGTDDSYINSGNFGVGLSNPKNLLHVNSTNTASRIQITNSTSGSGAGDGLLISSDATNAIITNQESGDIEFNTNSVDRMIIKSDGDVGIGTGSPQTKLHLHTAASVGQYLQITNGTSTTRGLQVGINNAGVAYILQKENFDFKIRTNDIDRFTIQADGDVGIGTDAPNWNLHVHNSGAATSFAQFTNSSTGSTAADGLEIGQSGGQSFIRNQENDDLNLGTNNTTRIKIKGNGDVGIGTSSPLNTLHLEGTETSDAILYVHNTSGNVQADGIYVQTGANNNPGNSNAFFRCMDGDGDNIGKITGNGSGGVTYNTTSDRRLKTKIEDYSNGLQLVMQIQPRLYERKSLLGKKEIGFIAQELQQVLPMAVSGDSTIDVKEDPMGVDYGLLTPVLTAAIQELNELVKQQQIVIESQRKQIEKLEANVENENLKVNNQKVQLDELNTKLDEQQTQISLIQRMLNEGRTEK